MTAKVISFCRAREKLRGEKLTFTSFRAFLAHVKVTDRPDQYLEAKHEGRTFCVCERCIREIANVTTGPTI
jgi:hypothetical protein